MKGNDCQDKMMHLAIAECLIWGNDAGESDLVRIVTFKLLSSRLKH